MNFDKIFFNTILWLEPVLLKWINFDARMDK